MTNTLSNKNESTQIEKTFFETPLVRRVLLFSFALFAMCFSLAVDFSHGSSFNDWIVYWTHLSCLSVLVWSGAALTSEFIKNEKFEGIVESWYWKGLSTITIIVTGTVFFVFGLAPVLYFGIVNNHPEVIISTIFLHIIVPSLMVWEFKSNSTFTKTRIEQTNRQKISIVFIPAALYFVFVMYMISKGANPPYPIFNYFSTDGIPNFIINSKILTYLWYIFSLAAAISVAIWFLFIAKVCLTWNERKSKKDKKTSKEKTSK